MESKKLEGTARACKRMLEPLSSSLGCLGGCSPTIDSSSSTSVQTTPFVTNSLNRRKMKPKLDQLSFRKSWTPSDNEESSQEFWASIKEPYDFIMETQLLSDSELPLKDEQFACLDAPSDIDMEMSWDTNDLSPAYIWTLSEFIDQYNELYEWLIQIQVKLYSHSNPSDKQLKKSQQDELMKHAYRRKLFVEQGEKVALRYPSSRDEIKWRINYLSNKWDQLQTSLTPVKGRNLGLELDLDLQHEEDLLCSWLSTMEGEIQPITCRLPRGCSLHALRERYKDNQILLKDIEAHGPILNSVLRQYERSGFQHTEKTTDVEDLRPPPYSNSLDISTSKSNNTEVQGESGGSKKLPQSVPRRAKSLEKRWHQIYLRSLEWHYYLEGVISDFKDQQNSSCSEDLNYEPVTKCRRLSTSSFSSAKSRVPQVKPLLKGWSDYDANSSEGGSFIEDDYLNVTHSDRGSRVKKVKRRRRFKKRPIKSFSCEFSSVCSKKVTDMEAVSSYSSTFLGNSKQEDGGGVSSFDQSSLETKRSHESPKRSSSNLLKVDKPSPNSAVFDYKHLDTDSDNNGNEVCSGMKSRNVKEKLEKPRKPLRRKMEFLDEEEMIQNDLQRIIDSAILDQDWLISNITSDSDSNLNEEMGVEQKDSTVVSQENPTGNGESCNIESSSAEIPTSSSISAKNEPLSRKSLDKESIHQLITGAEKLVRDPKTDPIPSSPRTFLKPLSLNLPNREGKQQRVKQWLKSQVNEELTSPSKFPEKDASLQDSCDASGEMTTEESDFDDDSTDNDISSATQKRSSGDYIFSSENTPTVEGFPLLPLDTSDNKNLSPVKKLLEKNRRSLTTSDEFQLFPSILNISKTSLSNGFPSSAESTSNCVQPSSDETQKRNSFCNSDSMNDHDNYANSSSADHPSNLSQSPTITSTTLLNQSGSLLRSPDRVSPPLVTSSSIRKRRTKFRRRSNQFWSRRSDSGSDERNSSKPSVKVSEVPLLPNVSFSPYHITKIPVEESSEVDNGKSTVKAAHFNGGTMIVPSSPLTSPRFNKPDSTSGSALSNLVPMNSRPATTMGASPPTSSQSANGSPLISPRSLISDQDASVHHEDMSSLSEQAWDPYQDLKSLSEAYSEDLDVDAARRLIDFGDDYRKYIDSDGSSFFSRSYRPRKFPYHRRARPSHKNPASYDDSDSDLDDLHHVIDESLSQLVNIESRFEKFYTQASLGLDLSELVATARANLKCLHDVLNKWRVEVPDLKVELKSVQNIVERWEALQTKAEEWNQQSTQLRQLQRQVKNLRLSMEEVLTQCSALAHPHLLDEPSQIGQKVQEIKTLLSQTENLRSDLSSLNVIVHRFATDVGSAFDPLKDDMTELYHLWDEMYRKANSELTRLQSAEATWRLWEEQKSELISALKQDSDTLKVIRAAIESGKLTDSLTSSAQDVARLLNERKKQPIGSHKLPEFLTLEKSDLSGKVSETITSVDGREDRHSDSGTSGYESCSSDDLSERERRLAYLRRLARELEASLVPGSKAWNEITDTLAKAEKELQDLQDHCRSLIQKTADTFDPSANHFRFFSNGAKRRTTSGRDTKGSRSPRLERRSSKVPGSASGSSRREWVWRVVRAAVPFQAVILLMLCVAYLLEPNCCDNANTFNFSLRPQFRYSHGSSPPI